MSRCLGTGPCPPGQELLLHLSSGAGQATEPLPFSPLSLLALFSPLLCSLLSKSISGNASSRVAMAPLLPARRRENEVDGELEQSFPRNGKGSHSCPGFGQMGCESVYVCACEHMS